MSLFTIIIVIVIRYNFNRYIDLPIETFYLVIDNIAHHTVNIMYLPIGVPINEYSIVILY